MPPKKKTPPAASPPSIADEAAAALAWLEANSTQHDRDNLGRFGIVAEKFFGVSMANLKVLAKRLGRRHDLAAALWDTGWYEARMLATLVDEPEHVTAAQMDRWCRDFDNWGICDTACFHLFDRTPHAWRKVAAWSGRRDEFAKRAAFALLACLALHDKQASDEVFLECLPLIEREASDERNFVKKAVSWALRSIGERSLTLNTAAAALANGLAASADATPRWIGKDVLRELARPATAKRLAAKSRGAKPA